MPHHLHHLPRPSASPPPPPSTVRLTTSTTVTTSTTFLSSSTMPHHLHHRRPPRPPLFSLLRSFSLLNHASPPPPPSTTSSFRFFSSHSPDSDFTPALNSVFKHDMNSVTKSEVCNLGFNSVFKHPHRRRRRKVRRQAPLTPPHLCPLLHPLHPPHPHAIVNNFPVDCIFRIDLKWF
ncbi:hypothetical protein RND81_O270400 [Saponaria officinalis]|uniref:Uncharacterized protein n=1 Tax=Saponaria officinalis TaxID=3572 RepID=A0AAW1GIT3_SAPOF